MSAPTQGFQRRSPSGSDSHDPQSRARPTLSNTCLDVGRLKLWAVPLGITIVLSGFLVGLIASVELGVVFGPNELATEEDQGGVIEHSQVPAGIVGENHEVSRCPYFDSG